MSEDASAEASPAPRLPGAPAGTDSGERWVAPLPPAGRLRLLWFVLRKASRDALGLRSAALAFLTLVSLVPLLAVVSIIAARGVGESRTPLVQLLVEVLPYSEEAIRSALEGFVAHADSVSGAAVIGFVIVILTTLLGVEETLNRIWNVPPGGTRWARLFSFLVVLASGPLLIGAGTSGLLYLGRQKSLEPYAGTPWAVAGATFLVTWLGLILLYRFVPNSPVAWSSAARGALLAAALVELLRYGFNAYVEIFQVASRAVYGGFAVLLFFFISVQTAWWVVLIGSVYAYAWQHRHALNRTPELEVEPADPWLGLAALSLVARRERATKQRTGQVELATRLGVSYVRLDAALEPLLKGKVLKRWRRRLRLGRDPEPLPLAQLFALYDAATPPALHPDLAPLDALRQRLAAAHREALGATTFGELFAGSPEPRRESALAAPPPAG